jgi:putative transposase
MYNAALGERREAYRRVKVTVRYGDQSAQLKDIRCGEPTMRVGRSPLSRPPCAGSIRQSGRLSAASKAGQTPGYPRFKGAGRWDTVEWHKDGDGCRWNSAPDSAQTRVYIQGVGHIRAHAHRKVDGRVKRSA